MINSKLWVNEFEYRRTVLMVVLFVIIFAGCIFVVNNWLRGYKVFALLELALVLLSVGILGIFNFIAGFLYGDFNWCI